MSERASVPGRRAAAIGLAVLLVIGAVGCGGAESSDPLGPPPTDATPQASPETPSENLEGIDETGHVTVDVATSWLTGAVGPIEGLEATPAYDPPTPAVAMAAINQVWPQLTSDEQQAVVAGVHGLAGLDGPTGMRFVAAVPSDDQKLADEVLGTIEQQIGSGLPASWTVKKAVEGAFAGRAVTVPVWATGKLASCLTILGDAWGDLDQKSRVSAMASEGFSCVQHDVLGEDGANTVPLWLIVGQSTWVGETVAGAAGSVLSASAWDHWLTTPDLPLTVRTDDAIGWFSTIEASTGSVWTSLLPMLRAPDRALPAMDPKALAQWGPRLARRDDVPDWQTVGPGVTASAAIPVSVDGLGPVAELAAGTAWIGKLVPSTPVLSIDLAGGAGAVAIGSTSYGLASTVTMCKGPEDCLCPDGSPAFDGVIVTPDDPAEPVVVAVAVATGTASVTLSEPKPTCPPPTSAVTDIAAAPGLDGTWISTGWALPVALFGETTGGDNLVLAIEDGTIAVDFGAMAPLIATVESSGMTVENVTTYTGALNGTLTVDGDRIHAEYTTGDAGARVETIVDGVSAGASTMSADQAAGRSGLALPATDATYTLDGDLLVLTQEIPGGGPTIGIEFRRAD